MFYTNDLPFRIAISPGSLKVNGNLRWKSKDSGLFGIDKQKELAVLPFRIAISPGSLKVFSNLKGYSGILCVETDSISSTNRVKVYNYVECR